MKLCLNRPAKQYLFISLIRLQRFGKYKEVMKCVGGGDGRERTRKSKWGVSFWNNQISIKNKTTNLTVVMGQIPIMKLCRQFLSIYLITKTTSQNQLYQFSILFANFSDSFQTRTRSYANAFLLKPCDIYLFFLGKRNHAVSQDTILSDN